MTTIVLLGACTVILAAASLFIIGVAVGFGIAQRRYCPKAERRQVGIVYKISAAEIDRRLKEGAFQ